MKTTSSNNEAIRINGLQQQTFEKLSRDNPDWEPRPQQLVMAAAVYGALKNNETIIIEAPTGIGKSLGYLIPAATAAAVLGRRTVIASATLPLQDQIWFKDIPLLEKSFPMSFAKAVLKGRQNYLCLRRLEESARLGVVTGQHLNESVIKEITGQLAKIIQSPAPEKDALDFIPHSSLWSQLSCNADRCPRQKCDYFRDCFLFKARRKAAKADIIITNHDLLMADTVWRGDEDEGSALPHYDGLIIDEAHRFERTALEHLSLHLSRFQAGRLKGDTEVILLSQIKSANRDNAAGKNGLPAQAQSIALALDANISVHKKVFEDWDKLHKPATNRVYATDTGTLGGAMPTDEGINSIVLALDELHEQLRKFGASESELSRESAEIAARVSRLKLDWESMRPSNRKNDLVYWYRVGAKGISFARSPISAGPELYRILFSRLKSCICTSATLSVNNSMSYFRDSCGLGECRELILDSPFDYSKQAALIVPRRLQNPNHGGFVEEASKILQDILIATKGRAFVLFTSFSTLDDFYQELHKPLSLQGLQVFSQRELPRSLLLSEFKKAPAPVLFGTNSFWEGVDIKGSALSCVVIMRLPFEQPSEPILNARLNAAKSQGQNAFMTISVPQAVIRLKQGLGRLIRSRKDRGIAMIMDTRIDTAFYGKIFKASLPPFRVIAAEDAGKFLQPRGQNAEAAGPG